MRRGLLLLGDRAIPPGLAESGLFECLSGDALKLYLWLRSRSRRVPDDTFSRATFLEAEATGAEIERAIGVSKNTVTKLARELQLLEIATFQGGRTGYRFRVGELLVRPAEAGGLELAAEVFYLDARLAARGHLWDDRGGKTAEDSPDDPGAS